MGMKPSRRSETPIHNAHGTELGVQPEIRPQQVTYYQLLMHAFVDG